MPPWGLLPVQLGELCPKLAAQKPHHSPTGLPTSFPSCHPPASALGPRPPGGVAVGRLPILRPASGGCCGPPVLWPLAGNRPPSWGTISGLVTGVPAKEKDPVGESRRGEQLGSTKPLGGWMSTSPNSWAGTGQSAGRSGITLTWFYPWVFGGAALHGTDSAWLANWWFGVMHEPRQQFPSLTRFGHPSPDPTRSLPERPLPADPQGRQKDCPPTRPAQSKRPPSYPEQSQPRNSPAWCFHTLPSLASARGQEPRPHTAPAPATNEARAQIRILHIPIA